MTEASLTVELGPQRLKGMFFVPAAPMLPSWIEAASFASTVSDSILYLGTTGPDASAPLRAALLDLIEHATEKVFLASFLFSDQRIAEALARKAERLRGGVYVLTALERSFRLDTGEPDEEEPGGREQIERDRRARHFENLRMLASAGAWLRSAGNLHAKLCVVDDRVALVTSANATEAAYEKNPENGVLIREPTLAKELGRVFARVFLHRVTHQSPPAAELDMKTFTPSPAAPWRPIGFGHIDSAVATIGRDGETSLLHATLELIHSAQHELMLAAFSAVDLRDHPVGLALRAAVSRGVRILLVLPPDHRRSDRRETGAWLFEDAPEGAVMVAGCPRAHAKAMIADGTHSLVWTGNLDGRRGYHDGFEVGLATARTEIAKSARAHVIELARVATHRGIFSPTVDTLADANGTPSPLSGGWTLVLPPRAPWSAATLADLLRTNPVAFALRESEIVLRVGDVAELATSIDEARRVLRVERALDRPSTSGASNGYLRGCRLQVTAGTATDTAVKKKETRRRRER